jgi:hypothetical protein
LRNEKKVFEQFLGIFQIIMSTTYCNLEIGRENCHYPEGIEIILFGVRPAISKNYNS